MVFSSSEFLFVFLPLFLLVYAVLPYKNLSYVLFSLFFYSKRYPRCRAQRAYA